jgi:hypothetical protein
VLKTLSLINTQGKSISHNVNVIIKYTNENAASKFLTADSDTYSKGAARDDRMYFLQYPYADDKIKVCQTFNSTTYYNLNQADSERTIAN